MLVLISLILAWASYSMHENRTSYVPEHKVVVKKALQQDQGLPSVSALQSHTLLSVQTILKVYKEAESGNADAQAALATGYITGSIGNLPNYKEALYWLKKSAAQNNGLAFFTLFDLYYKGAGVKQNIPLAIEYAKKAIPLMEEAIKTHPNKYNLYYWRLARANFWGIKGVVKQNFKKAFEYYHHAALQGDYHSMLSIVFMYRHGLGTEKNNKEAFKWSKYLAENGLSVAAYRTGLDYLHGKGIKANREMAIKWLNKSALDGFYPAMTEISKIADSGNKTILGKNFPSWGSAYKQLELRVNKDRIYESAAIHL